MKETTKVREARQALARAQRERERLRARHKRERDRADAVVRRAEKRVRSLTGERARAPRTAAVQAGPMAMATVLDYLTAHGEATQAEIAREARTPSRKKLNDGTVSYALRALMEQGVVVPTRRKVAGSREFRLSARAVRAA